MAAHNELGKWGEQQAMAFLQSKGYTIIEHDWRSAHKDIDIIALDHGAVVFIEVKTRNTNPLVSPIASVNYRKRTNLLRAINHYIHYHHLGNNVRFDIITVVGSIGDKPVIEHFQDIRLI